MHASVPNDHATDGDALPATPAQVYRRRRQRFARERDGLTRTWNRVANARLLVAGLLALCLGGFIGTRVIPFAVGAVLCACGFVVLVRYHGAIDRAKRRAEDRWRIADEALARLARAWDALPLHHPHTAPADHPYAADLGIFGHASLLHLLDALHTPMGEHILRRWLTEPASVAVINERQAAVAELAPLVDWRDELRLRLIPPRAVPPDPEPLLAWAESAPRLTPRRWVVWAAWASPLLLLLSLLVQIAGVVAYPLWGIFAITNLALGQTVGKKATRTLIWAAGQTGALHAYAEALRLVSDTAFHAPALQRLHTDLAVDGRTASARLQHLRKIAAFVLPPTAMVHGIAQALVLWDLHVLAALEQWQARAGKHARRWLLVVGEVEALAALALLAHDQPSWCFPTIDPQARAITARDLGHPLLPDGARITNDVTVGPIGTFLFVTGSNMSGKSTLLRAIGANVVLAQAGGPVCATALQMPPVTLWTSMQLRDSLEHGVSYFMAELQRLKAVVDAARAYGDRGEGVFCYLFDEMFQGTNTAERQIASRRVICYLIAHRAIGAVATHDLGLADTDAIGRAACPVHFTETITAGADGPAMSFDYKLRTGIATSSNALHLMEIVGLSIGEQARGEP